MKRIFYVIGVLLTFGAIYYADAIPPSPSAPPSGSTSITTLGTVTTGTWEGTKIGIGYGGTNATNATDARTNLGLGSIATQNADAINATGGNVTGLTNLGAANLTVTSTANVTGASFTGLTVGSVTGAAATADLADDLATASHSIYKDSAGNITNIITAIDASAANTTIALIPGICATIHNYEQGDANAVSTLPAIAEGLCFTGLVTTTEDDKTFRFNAAAANTICLGATCGKDDIGFATGQNTKGGMFKCIAIATDWFCHTITGTVDAGDL